MGYEKGRESNSLSAISRALHAGLLAGAPAASTPPSQQPLEPAVAAPTSKGKRRKPAAEPSNTGRAASEALKAKKAKRKSLPLGVSDAPAPGLTAQAARELDSIPEGGPEATQAPAQLTFRDVYVRGFTDAYAADLEALRQAEGEGLRLDLLQRCIEAGMDVFTDVERRLCVRAAVHHAGGTVASLRPPGSVVHPWL